MAREGNKADKENFQWEKLPSVNSALFLPNAILHPYQKKRKKKTVLWEWRSGVFLTKCIEELLTNFDELQATEF